MALTSFTLVTNVIYSPRACSAAMTCDSVCVHTTATNYVMAEREGLEPSHHLAVTYRFSKPAPSPTWVPLQKKMEVN